MLSLLLALACSHPTPAPVAVSQADEAALARAEAAAQELGTALKVRLQDAVAHGGPVEAVMVCAEEAQEISREAQGEGVDVGRSSTRLRNPANQGPEWVTAWLAEQGDASASEVQARKWLEDTEQGRVARVVRPLPAGAMCVACHGSSEQIPVGIQRVLTERYPTDQATGYTPGDLRGVLWAEARVRGD